MAIEFFDSSLLTVHYAGDRWQVSSFSGPDITITPINNTLPLSYQEGVILKGTAAVEIPRWIECQQTVTNGWGKLWTAQWYLFRTQGDLNYYLVNGGTFPDGWYLTRGYFQGWWQPETSPAYPWPGGAWSGIDQMDNSDYWYNLDPLGYPYQVTYDEADTTTGWLWIELNLLREVGQSPPIIQLGMHEYIDPEAPTKFWTSYVKTREKFLT